MEDSDITNLVRTMNSTEALSQDHSEREEQSMQDSIPVISTVRRGNLMRPGAVARLTRGSEDGRSFASHTR